MDILSKTAEPFELGRTLEDESPIMLYPCDEFSMVTWKTNHDMENEFYPNQIVQALMLSKTATKRRYRFIPSLLGFYKIDDRLCLRLSCEQYSLRYMLA